MLKSNTNSGSHFEEQERTMIELKNVNARFSTSQQLLGGVNFQHETASFGLPRRANRRRKKLPMRLLYFDLHPSSGKSEYR